MKNRLPLLFLAIVLVFVYWYWWLPGPRVANDSSIISSNLLKSFLNPPFTWSVNGTEGWGEYSVFTLWSWPLNLLEGILANLNINFVVIERIVFILPVLVLGAIGIWKLASKNLNLSIFAKSVSIFFYLTTTYVLLLIDGGQFTIAISYAIFPLTYLLIQESINATFKKKVISGLVTSLMGIFDIRFVLILFMLCFARFFYEFLFLDKKKTTDWFLEWIKTGFTILIIILGLNAYWLLVLLKYPLTSGFYQYLTQTSFESLVNISHALFIYSPHWYKNVFGDITSPGIYFIFIPILVFTAPVLKQKNKEVGFWLLVSLIGIFLTKGASEPFANFYIWLYQKIPGFSLFRDSSKFFFFIAISYALLIGITIDELLKRIKKNVFQSLLFMVVIGYLVILVNPVWLGKMTGAFSSSSFLKDYEKLNQIISSDKSFSNVLWVPNISPMTSLDSNNPALEAERLLQKRPFAQANIGSYETFNYLREASYIGNLLEIGNVGYLAYPFPDKRRETDKDKIKYYYTFLDQLSKLPWLTKIDDSSIPFYKTKSNGSKLFITPNVWWVIGSDSIYKESTISAKLNLASNSLIFAEENPNSYKQLEQLPQIKIVLYNKTETDFAASFIDSNNLVFPSQYLESSPNNSGWWKRTTSDFLYWKDFLKNKYGIYNQDFDFGGGWAIAEGNLHLTINDPKVKSGNILLARVLESTRSGELSFYQNNNLIGQISTKNKGDNVRWFKIGNLKQDQVININASGDINVINALAIVSQSNWQVDQEQVERYKTKIVSFSQKNVNNWIATVSFKEINPTKYEIKIDNLNSPAMLVFSQNYNPNWKLNGQSPFLDYSFLNGFKIEKNGSYELYFEPQKYIPIGLLISGFCLLVCILFLIL